MSNHFHPVAIVCTVGVAALAVGAVSAQSNTSASVEASIAAAKDNGTLNAVVAELAKTVSPEALAQAMVNQGVSYDAAIAALASAGVPIAKVSVAMYAAVPASEVAKLDKAIASAGGELPATGAGRGNGNGNNGNNDNGTGNNGNGNNGTNGNGGNSAGAPFGNATGGGGGGGGNASRS